MNKGMYKGLPLLTKLIFFLPDMLGVCSMVHMKIESSQ
jgi:hypothetical protein